MKDYIILTLPYPVRIWFVKLSINRKVGFLFTNLAKHIFHENNNINTSQDLEEWNKINGTGKLVSEMFYASAMAYCMKYYKRPNFDKHKLIIAINSSSEEAQGQLVKAYQSSESFGIKEAEKKKLIQTRIRRTKKRL